MASFVSMGPSFVGPHICWLIFYVGQSGIDYKPPQLHVSWQHLHPFMGPRFFHPVSVQLCPAGLPFVQLGIEFDQSLGHRNDPLGLGGRMVMMRGTCGTIYWPTDNMGQKVVARWVSSCGGFLDYNLWVAGAQYSKKHWKKWVGFPSHQHKAIFCRYALVQTCCSP